ncbi:aldehyde dehydrogenase family protein [Streptomyces sp. LHD-70]|uniref:aldehyde dehydrogenase family protein n=1 Tax=Streptomyces sp. LHD-70 TaxID=3072140 RepID=UPI00280CC076|nr:aldehyde dehydrogenase family protein [Streptomyces sp. LHD-70]MDQ8702611.1 aldehyde dehydrogenase family protein [Streptomyces sp. LHD-70]
MREIINPYDQSVVRTVAEGGPADAEAAVAAARKAFDGDTWPSWTPRRRAEPPRRTAELLQRDREEIARLCKRSGTGALRPCLQTPACPETPGTYGPALEGGADHPVPHRPRLGGHAP